MREMTVLRFAPSRPRHTALTENLRRAATYRFGHAVSDAAIDRWLDVEWDAWLQGLDTLGAWLRRLEIADAASQRRSTPRPRSMRAQQRWYPRKAMK